MKTIILSTAHHQSGSFAMRYPRYERVQRRTPGGRIYDTLTMTNPDGSGCIHTSELAPDASRAIRGISRCEFKARRP